MNVLSIDWDYFFPDLIPYDWGHSEHIPLLLEAIWSHRASCRNYNTRERAVDVVKPDPKLINSFWKKLNLACDPLHLVVSESHKDLYTILKQIKDEHNRKCTVWSFDQHHDLGYLKDAKLDCGNWAQHAFEDGLMKKMHLVYPAWRRETPESGNWKTKKVTVSHLPPRGALPQFFAVIFICRSGAWTPTWCDNRWIKFIEYCNKNKQLWEGKSFSEFSLKKRSPDLKEAKKLAVFFEKKYKELHKMSKKKGQETRNAVETSISKSKDRKSKWDDKSNIVRYPE